MPCYTISNRSYYSDIHHKHKGAFNRNGNHLHFSVLFGQTMVNHPASVLLILLRFNQKKNRNFFCFFFFFCFTKKCVKNIIFELGEFTTHTRTHKGKQQASKRVGKTHTDSYVVLYCCSLCISLVLVSSIPLSSHRILCDGCSQPLKMQEGPNESREKSYFNRK